ncbi:uncharacterized protein LOC115639552 isoform X1 [Gopherus evgoodei]|uniref:uncharacterized protein LOC115639552 isoform X1 n=1 Tax=Gopherus evgoodei TaxID=1825980 RepID=UPI0011CFB542|nr:uncharacterized protein LOC115639552 isoform X1 [Gopherus evgoodei]
MDFLHLFNPPRGSWRGKSLRIQLHVVEFQRMGPKDRSVWWVWISVLCAGTVARAAEQGQLSKDMGERGPLGGTASYLTWTAERTDRNATWVTTNTATSTEGGPTTPNATVLLPGKDTTRRKTSASVSSSIKFWVPPAFMVIALITLYFTYRKTTERESRSRAGSIDQSSDSDSKDNQVVHGAAHVIPHQEAWNQTHAEMLQAKETLSTEKDKQALSDPDPSPSQIDQNAAADSAAPHSDPRMSDPVRASWPLSATSSHGETTEALVTFEESSV